MTKEFPIEGTALPLPQPALVRAPAGFDALGLGVEDTGPGPALADELAWTDALAPGGVGALCSGRALVPVAGAPPELATAGAGELDGVLLAIDVAWAHVFAGAGEPGLALVTDELTVPF